MKRNHIIEAVVGLFLVLSFLALLVLAFWVSGLTTMGHSNYYTVTADFDNIGGLKVRAPVSMSGVKIGQVMSIALDPKTFRAHVVMDIQNSVHDIPMDSSASILTQGLLGSNYISIAPGLEQKGLANGSVFETTHSALVLEDVIGQLIYKVKNDGKDDKADKTAVSDKPVEVLPAK